MGAKRAETVDWTGRTLFGKWTVERLIGIGGTAAVFQARHRNGRRAALKVLHPHLAAQPRTRERFLREARLANRVDHPGVVAVLDDFVDEDGSAVLVLELVPGGSLAAQAREAGGRLPVHEVLAAASAVLEVLCAAHAANVIHRDIKPENILFSPKTGYRLADFGLAGVRDELGVLTLSNAALGTPAFMSPEQARGDARQVDARSDLYALAASIFTLVSGRFLHDAGSPRNLLVAAATEPAPPVRSLAPEIPIELATLLDRALQMQPEARFPDAASMRSALADLRLPLQSPGLAASAAAPPRALDPTLPSSATNSFAARAVTRRAPAALLVLGLGSCASLLVAGWLSQAPPPPSAMPHAIAPPKPNASRVRGDPVPESAAARAPVALALAPRNAAVDPSGERAKATLPTAGRQRASAPAQLAGRSREASMATRSPVVIDEPRPSSAEAVAAPPPELVPRDLPSALPREVIDTRW